jgi:penicillin-binding protein 1C
MRVKPPLRRAMALLRRHRRRLAVSFTFGIFFIVVSMAVIHWPMDTSRYLESVGSPEMLDRRGTTLHVFLDRDEQWRLVRGLNRISPHLIRATIAAEDRRFVRHAGVDPAAVARAALQNLRHGRIVSGASTLPMQVVKLAGVGSRSATGKLRQAIGALRLDAHASKGTILAAYLNRAPYGQNLVGCEAAARRYFGKPAAELTLPEAALLAGLPRSPARTMPLAHPEAARARRNDVLRRMREQRFIDEAQYRRASAAPLGVAWHAFPAEAPHLAMRLRSRLEGAPLPTTLDDAIQKVAEETLRRHLDDLGGEVDSGAVVVLETATARTLAHVGSPDFFDEARAGQFDATAARRSPGSTLKPFLYALAIDRDRLHPGETLLDDTFDLGRYNPRNFDERFRGLVRADSALRQSLNIPAMLVIERVGAAEFLECLRRCGLDGIDDADRYGLGLALGNCEARLDRLAAAYAMLVNRGVYRPAVHVGDDAAPGATVLSAGACLAICQALRRPLPGEIDAAAVGAIDTLPPVAWKTGTSTGNRDAWAFVFNGHYVVGVWIGNHDGRRSSRLVGADAALPTAAEIFRGLPPLSTPAWPETGGELRPIEVCALSGLPATPWCPHLRVDPIPRGQLLHRRCDVHWPAGETRNAALERWPGDARHWDLAAVRAPFVRRPDRAAPAYVRDLRIAHPAAGAEFVPTGVAGGDRIQPRCSLDDRGPLHWFLDDRYAGRSLPGRPISIPLAPGEHRLVCVAPGRQTAQTHFTVAPVALGAASNVE